MDVITYALCKKMITSSSTGIKNIEVNEKGDLVFTMGDGQQIIVDMPIKMDCLDLKFTDNIFNIPSSEISDITLYVQDTKQVDEEDNPIYAQFIHRPEGWRKIGISGMPIATSKTAGLVKPDGKTILVDANGTISVSNNYTEGVIDSTIGEINNKMLIEDEDIKKLFNND